MGSVKVGLANRLALGVDNCGVMGCIKRSVRPLVSSSKWMGAFSCPHAVKATTTIDDMMNLLNLTNNKCDSELTAYSSLSYQVEYMR